ncbi:hypothetical protein [Roseateles amylovorans]|uniref:Uncharacterized protein n=1 Tax=Roseateles amylovorans TaxID=2978473 RepID=A0ABY6B5U9_9BURK|nr:hypothetical protein [Roseateles amylovorans]UXH80544.1 hypothetical protein N4261_12000 [Roseateles amylovorans]
MNSQEPSTDLQMGAAGTAERPSTQEVKKKLATILSRIDKLPQPSHLSSTLSNECRRLNDSPPSRRTGTETWLANVQILQSQVAYAHMVLNALNRTEEMRCQLSARAKGFPQGTLRDAGHRREGSASGLLKQAHDAFGRGHLEYAAGLADVAEKATSGGLLMLEGSSTQWPDPEQQIRRSHTLKGLFHDFKTRETGLLASREGRLGVEQFEASVIRFETAESHSEAESALIDMGNALELVQRRRLILPPTYVSPELVQLGELDLPPPYDWAMGEGRAN